MIYIIAFCDINLGDNMKLLSHYIEHQKIFNRQISNWENHMIGDRIFYSYRDTMYERETYPSNLHYHDYYELVIFEEGDIEYVCDGCVYKPKYGDIILIPPSKFHMSMINCEKTHYKRHVFYLYPSAFDSIGYSDLACFLERTKNGDMFTFDLVETKREVMNILQNLKKVWNKESSVLEDALGFSFIIQIFYLLNQNNCQIKNESSALPEIALQMQEYIDQNYSEISSVSQVAEHFYYSREYLSRLFRKHFDSSVSDYIKKKRIAESQILIVQGHAIIDIAYKVGFSSLSTFIRAFRSVTNMTPSEYRKLRKEIL